MGNPSFVGTLRPSDLDKEKAMGILAAIKDLLGSSGVGELVESTGIAEHLGGITEAVQAPVEEVGTAITEVSEAMDPLTGQL
jgi:hypothetical protein